jgi:hypothetical protein
LMTVTVSKETTKSRIIILPSVIYTISYTIADDRENPKDGAQRSASRAIDHAVGEFNG